MKTTNISGTYVRPEAEEIILKVESIICASQGSEEDLDDPIEDRP